MEYIEEYGDVTKQPHQFVIAHCISVDCAMGAGVVVPIKKKHPGDKPACIEFVKSHPDALGKAFRYEDSKGVCYNMFSKVHVFENYKTLGNTYLKNLRYCLMDLKHQMQQHEEKFLALPQIGSGLDRCDWNDVKSIIKEVFNDTQILVKVCLWK